VLVQFYKAMSFRHLALHFAFTIGILFAPNCGAEIDFEPYAGLQWGRWSSHGDGEFYQLSSFGGRLGYSFMGLAAGAEFMGGAGGDAGGSSLKSTNTGIYVSFSLPTVLRFYGTFFPISRLGFDTFQVDSAYMNSPFKGTAAKAGLSLTFLPFVNINFEYISSNYNNDDRGALAFNVLCNALSINIGLPMIF
jgi:hypothetical protein